MPLRINGATSGYIELAAPAVAGTTTLTLPTDSIQPALVKVADQSFTAASSVIFNNCFTSMYENYRIVFYSGTASGNTLINARLRAATTDDVSANYSYQSLDCSSTAVVAARGTAQTSAQVGVTGTGQGWFILDIFRPNLAVTTQMLSIAGLTTTAPVIDIFSAGHVLTTSYDGITLYPSSSTITGTVRVYGYRN